MWFSKSNSCRSRVVNRLIPLLLFIGVFSAVIATIEDYGLIWDEPFYIENANSIEHWFRNVSGDSSFLSNKSIDTYWNGGYEKGVNGNAHPPFYKLSGIVFRYLLGTALFDNIVYQYRVTTAFWTAILVVILFMVIRKFTRSNTWGLLGGGAFIASPRFFAEAHFFTSDMMIASLGFSGLAVFMFASNSRQRILFGGMLFGAALATKFTGTLALAIVAPMIFISDDRKRFAREYGLLIVTACVFFSLFNFPVLFDPQRELSFYFSSVINRKNSLPLTSIYFGKSYAFDFPLSQPWVMFGITIPPVVVLTAFTGLMSGAVQFARNRDRFAYFAVTPFLCLMVVYMLPMTPKHDGIRLLSSAWPFIILLSVYGCYWMQSQFKNKYRVGMLVCVTGVLLSVRDLRAYYPHGLSYYNVFIGGAIGAQEKELTVTYWYEAFNRDFFNQMAQIVGKKNARVYSWPYEEMINNNQKYGLYPEGLQSVGEDDDYEYVVVLNRYYFAQAFEYIRGCRPLIELTTKDGAYIGGLYQRQIGSSPLEDGR